MTLFCIIFSHTYRNLKKTYVLKCKNMGQKEPISKYDIMEYAVDNQLMQKQGKK